MNALKRLANAEKAPERCDLCALPLAARHAHLFDPGKRELVCSCDGCAVLFDSGGATKLRRVPRDVIRLDELVVPDDEWKRLLVPINLAFFYRSSVRGMAMAGFPSPAGVTEAELEPGAWENLARRNPRLERIQEDVEALLVNRVDGRKEHFLVPIDRCFELVGVVRKSWKGMTGGDRIWEELGRFFDAIREEARP